MNLQSCTFCLQTISLSAISDADLIRKIDYCLNITMNKSDDRFCWICINCVDALDKFYEFRKKCRALHKRLQKNAPQENESDLRKENGNYAREEWKILIEPEIDEMLIKDLDSLDICVPNESKNYKKEIADNYDENFIDLPFQNDNLGSTRNTKEISSAQDVSRNSIHPSVQCELCGKIYKHKAILKKHLLTHEGVKQYACKICNKKFTRAEHEIVHMRAHRGIRPFICEVCARGFTKRQDLLRHMRVHSDEKKFSCPRCDKRFKRSGDVRSHMRSHTGHKPYACNICHKRYSSHSGFRKHQRTQCCEEAKSQAHVGLT